MRNDDEALERLRAAIEQVAESEAGAIVAEARAQARAKVRAILAEAMADALLEQARAELQLPSGTRTRVRRSSTARTTPAPSRASALAKSGQRRTSAAAVSEDRAAAGAGAPSTQRAVEGGDERASLGWYVYCVVDQDSDLQALLGGASGLAGIDGVHPLTVIHASGLGAVASRVSLAEFGEETLRQSVEDLQWLENNARTHEYVLDSIRERATVVPMRLCTIYRTEDSVREMLAREGDFLADALTRLAGRTEWGVKIFLNAADARPARDSSGARELADQLTEAGPGESYMLSKRLEALRAEETRRAAHEACEAGHERLSAAAVEARLNQLQPRELADHDGEMILNAVYLVEDAVSDEFTAAVAALKDELRGDGFDVQLTGPWPPYNFVNSSAELGR